MIGLIAVLSFGLPAVLSVLLVFPFVPASVVLPLVPLTFVVGFFLLVPLVAVLGDRLPFVAAADGATDATDEADEMDPVARLRERYARGDLSDEEFERRLERLVETEEEAGVERVARDGSRTESDSGDTSESARERDPEYEVE